jgi:hypothetical protein
VGHENTEKCRRSRLQAKCSLVLKPVKMIGCKLLTCGETPQGLRPDVRKDSKAHCAVRLPPVKIPKHARKLMRIQPFMKTLTIIALALLTLGAATPTPTPGVITATVVGNAVTINTSINNQKVSFTVTYQTTGPLKIQAVAKGRSVMIAGLLSGIPSYFVMNCNVTAGTAPLLFP